MGKNIRRGRTSSVHCASCGQTTRRDRAVYLFRDGIKAYYCPDCAKKIHGSRLYKGMPKFIKKRQEAKTKRKFVMYTKDYSTEEPAQLDSKIDETDSTKDEIQSP
ncbi:hypothetical protein M1293_01015 [Candidatus Parvarchaeota archaeon]|nr:hypothetical protein [Candidatus Parvarchaeota archaeon]